jgi:hypothetical protein
MWTLEFWGREHGTVLLQDALRPALDPAGEAERRARAARRAR